MVKVYLAGKNGLLGSFLYQDLQASACDFVATSSHELDLRDRAAVRAFFDHHRPSHTILSAARTGGLLANQNVPLEFLEDNISIQQNVFNAAYEFNCKTVIFIASSTVYPEAASQPFDESALFSGKLHPSIASYGYAKLLGVHSAQIYNNYCGMDIRCIIPCNLYGPTDKFDAKNKHVIPALIDKFLHAKMLGSRFVEILGSGLARREFLYAADASNFIINYCINTSSGQWLKACHPENFCINIGAEDDVKIRDLVEKIRVLTQYSGEIRYKYDKNDGILAKKVSCKRARSLGWRPKVPLEIGLARTIEMREGALK